MAAKRQPQASQAGSPAQDAGSLSSAAPTAEDARALLGASGDQPPDSEGQEDVQAPPQEGSDDSTDDSDDVTLRFDGGVTQKIPMAELAKLYQQRQQLVQREQGLDALANQHAADRQLLDWLRKTPAAQTALQAIMSGATPPGGQNGSRGNGRQGGGSFDFDEFVQGQPRQRQARQENGNAGLESRLAQIEGVLGEMSRERWHQELDRKVDHAIASVPELRSAPAAVKFAKDAMRRAMMLDRNADLSDIARQAGIMVLQTQGTRKPVQQAPDYRGSDDGGGWNLDKPEKPYDRAALESGGIMDALLQSFREGQ